MIYVIIFVIATIFALFFGMYNVLVKANNMVKEAFSTMDVYLKKRWDLIPNIVSVTKGYAKHEKDTLESITELRNGVYDDLSSDEKIKKNEALTGKINNLMALAESYPELKASDNFRKLSDNLVVVENDIANARKYYNGTIRLYNNKVEMFPTNIVAGIIGYKTKNMFEASSEEKENINVKLNQFYLFSMIISILC